MTSGDLFRVEFRVQNSVHKYYLVREIFSDAHKFSASRLITSGTPPAKAQINRCAALYGFDLELKCIAKAAKYRIEHFRYDVTDGGDSVFELERHRLLLSRKFRFISKERFTAEYIASAPGISLSADEIVQLFAEDKIPRNSALSQINRVQNLHNAVAQRDGKAPSAAKLVRIYDILAANLGRPELSLDDRENLKKLNRAFSERVHQGFYPFEQCILFHDALKTLFPEEDLFTYEVFASLLDAYGYLMNPSDAVSLEAAATFAHAANPVLEQEVRRLNEQKFRVKAGGKQKRLEFFCDE
ncbi:MAG TPA: hypothetical protein O0X97_04670 [Methanocorpusculum sp.]|nr:hypothetical protein [Methanocorpusculum sp.]